MASPPTDAVALPPRQIGELPDTTKEFPSWEKAHLYLDNLAKSHGFNMIKRDSYPNPQVPKKVTFTCNKSRTFKTQADPDTHKSKKRKVATKKTNCPFKVKAVKTGSSTWILEIHSDQHNHEPNLDPKSEPANRLKSQPDSVISEIKRLYSAGNDTASILATLQLDNPDIPLEKKDILNVC
jgi:hypothetical protein